MRFNKAVRLRVIVLTLLTSCVVGGAVLHDRSATAPPEVDESRLEFERKTRAALYTGEPYTGVSVKRYESGQVQERVSYLKGRREGPRSKWYPDGSLSLTATYRDGKRQGRFKTFWKNGQLRTEANVDRGVPHGLQRQWYRSGALFKETQLDHGIERGLQRAWRENGAIYNNYEAKNGRIYGLRRSKLCFQLSEEEIVLDSNNP